MYLAVQMGAGSSAQVGTADPRAAVPALKVEDDPRTAELRQRGNVAFSNKEFTEAISMYTQCIERDNTDARLFSNRSAAHVALGDYGRALSDAYTAIELSSSWSKGYYRCGVALMALHE